MSSVVVRSIEPSPVTGQVLSYPCLYADTTQRPASRPYRLTLTAYPDLERLTLTRACAPFRVHACAVSERRERDAQWRARDNERRSVTRARQAVEDLVICNRLSCLITPTLGGGAGSDAEVRAIARGFLSRRTGGRWFREWMGEAYIGVAGVSDGDESCHVHFAVRRSPAREVLERLRLSWTEHLSRSCGVKAPTTSSGLWRVDVALPAEWQTPATLGAYLARHISPSSGPGRRYLAPQGMARPVREVHTVWLTDAEAWEMAAARGQVRRITDSLTGRSLGLTVESPLSPTHLN